MLALTSLIKSKNFSFLIYIFIAATLHKSAIILLPIVGFAVSRSRFLTFFFGFLFLVLGYYLFLQDAIERLIYAYIDSGLQSEGALIRLAMNAIPGILFLIYRRRYIFTYKHETNLWSTFSYFSIFLLLAYFFFPSSTVLDRIALYFLPLQIVFFSSLPYAVTSIKFFQQFLVFLVISYYFFVLSVWLFFASHSFSWIPYQSIIFS